MNRKNLTAAVLAGLAGAAGIAGTAQAVNLNPDGLGQVLIYPYYTSNDGNATILSVVNTTDHGKAVKVRFKEGFNSREVLDFNLYMSAYDVWVAAIAEGAHVSGTTGTPTLYIPDSTCTVPYLYLNAADDSKEPGDQGYAGAQEFLPYAYTGDHADEGPTSIQRAAEGYFEMIEMGTIHDDTDTYSYIEHEVDENGVQAPADCDALVEAWTGNPDGYWLDHVSDDPEDEDYVANPESIDISRNSGGLFGGAAVINVANGTMFSYDARAIQGFDKRADGNHVEPGTSEPSLNSGNQSEATVFFGVPNDKAVTLKYPRGVDAVSAVFMHEYTMNEYNIQAGLHAASEWVLTFPTKAWYVDREIVEYSGQWIPDSDDIGCGGWEPGDEIFPARNGPDYTDSVDLTDVNPANNIPDVQEDWVLCSYIEIETTGAIPPFTDLFDGESCDPFSMRIWDREEDASSSDNPSDPPIVSPPPPGGSTPDVENVICYEVNVLRFGNGDDFPVIFGTPTIQGSSLLKTVDTGSVEFDESAGAKPRANGWARINWFSEGAILEDEDYYYEEDYNGLVGLPVTGFWAEQFENGFLGTPEASILSNYGGLFQHKGNVRRIAPSYIMD
jgi:hypothetical protein